MKNLFFTVLAVCCTISFVNAQTTIIPKAGITLSKFAVKDDEGMKFKLGFSGGVGFNFALSEAFSIQPELLFIQKGAHQDITITASSELNGVVIEEWFISSDLKTTINYIELPILVKASFGSDNLKFFINAGPSIGLGLGGKYKGHLSFLGNNIDLDGKVKFGKTPEDEDTELEPTEGSFTSDIYFNNRIDVGLQLGGGVLIANKIQIDIRYGLGLTNLMDKQEGASDDDIKSKNRVIQFTVGIPISLN